jgi:hypothetical protein
MHFRDQPRRRLIGAGGLPDVAGQPTQVQLHVTLDLLRGLAEAADAEACACDAKIGGWALASPSRLWPLVTTPCRQANGPVCDG